MNLRHHLPHVATLLAVAFCLAACTPDNVVDDDDDPVNPVNPIDDKDAVTVTPDGGVVTRGDISITFPRGTFSEDVKVAVTEEKKGDVLGEDEVSTFYKLTVPPQIDKPLTVTIKCDEQGDDINVVAHAPSYQLSEDINTYNDILLESSYSNGAYTVTLPSTSNNDIDDGTMIPISIGVAHLEYCGDRNPSEVKATRAAVFDEKFTEGNVSWHFDFKPFFKHAYSEELTLHWDEINDVIREAIKKLHGLGLEVTKRDIGMSFAELGEPDGTFCQSIFSNEWSTVAFNTRIIRAFDDNRDKFRRSAIHELMHVFQADYDSRSACNKAGGLFRPKSHQDSDELLLLYESGAVWAEQFMGGSFSSGFASQYLPGFTQGFENINEIYGDNDRTATTRHKKYEHHGYAASVLMQYITKKMRDYNLNDRSIVSLYKIWKGKNYWFSSSAPKDCIKELTKQHDLFALDYYDDFLLCLAKGELVTDITANNMSSKLLKILKDTPPFEISGNCYNYGAQTFMFSLLIPDDVPLDSKQLVVDQKENDVQTYLLMPEPDNAKKYYQYGYKAWKDAPLTINGAELKRDYHSNGDRYTKFVFYVLTTTKLNNGTKPYKLRVALEDAASVKPTSLNFPTEGGTKHLAVIPGGYNRFGATVREEGHGWCSVHAHVEDSCYVDIIVQPNTTGQKRECIVDCYVTNESNPTEEQMVKLPVKVTQEAGDNELEVESINSFYFDAYFNTIENNDDVEYEHNYTDGYNSYDEQGYSITQSGNKISISYEKNVNMAEEQITENRSFSFEIINFKGDCNNVMVQNLRKHYLLENKHEYGPYWTHDDVLLMKKTDIAISSIPKTKVDFITNSIVDMTFEITGAQGLNVTDFTHQESWLYDVRHDYEYKYIAEPENRVKFTIKFKLKSAPSSAPRQCSHLPSMPWSTTTEAAVKR